MNVNEDGMQSYLRKGITVNDWSPSNSETTRQNAYRSDRRDHGDGTAGVLCGEKGELSGTLASTGGT